MINHYRPKETCWDYNDSLGGFVLESFSEIEHGVEVFDSYGQKSNKRFLLNYGFVEENNDDNEVTFYIPLPEFIDKSLHRTLLNLNHKDEVPITIKANFDDPTVSKTLSILRMVESSQEEASKVT